jgi:hypothetical protein
MLRKIAVWLLLIPLPLNGLWMVCREAPPEAQKLSRSYAGPDENLFDKFANLPVDDTNAASAAENSPGDERDSSTPECSRICAIRSGAGGPTCLFASGAKASMTIIVFGVAVPPAQVEAIAAAPTNRSIAERADFYRSPNLGHFTPPPKA